MCLFRLLNSQINHATSRQRTSVISHFNKSSLFIVPKLECSPQPITGSLFPRGQSQPSLLLRPIMCDPAIRRPIRSAPLHRAAAELCRRAATQHSCRLPTTSQSTSTNFPRPKILQQSGLSRGPYRGQPPLLLTTHKTLTKSDLDIILI